MTNNKRVVRNYIYNTLYQFLVLIAPLITIPYVSRILGDTGIGIYSYSQSIATYFVLVGAVGTTLYGQREIAYTQNNPEKRSEVFWEIITFRFCTVFVCSAIYYLTFATHGQYPVVAKILTLEVIATAFDTSWFFMGIENFRITVIRNLIIKVCGIVLIFLLVKKPDDVPLYTLCLTVPIFLGNISLWFSLKNYLVKLNHSVVSGIPKHIKPILILFLPQIATEVYTVLDKTMLGVWGSDIAQVGCYTQAQKVVMLTLLMVTSLGTVMLPAMSAAFAQERHDEMMTSIKNAFQFTFMLSFSLFFGLIAIAKKFVPVFFGPGFDLVVPLMIGISPIIVIVGISNVIGRQYLLPTKQQGSYTVSIVTGACVNFILNLILINLYDAMGAVIATVIAEIAVSAVQMWHVRDQLPLADCFKPALRYLIMGAIMSIIVYTIGGFLPEGIVPLILMIIIGVIVYFLELVITKDKMLRYGLRLIKKKEY